MIATKPAPQPQRHLFALLGLAALCLLAVLGLAASAVLAAGKSLPKHRPAARIEVLSPTFDARVGGTLDARVRVSTTAGFTASLAGHNVTKRFHRNGGVMEAQLRRGRDFDLGKNNLLIAAGNGRAMRATTVRFFSRSQAQGLLTVTRLDPRSDSTPLRFRISVSASVARMKVTVNHRRYRIGSIEGRRSWTIAVGAGDGLRYGPNTLRAMAERVDGTRFDRESLGFKVSHAAPLVSAGPDRVTRPGRGIVLDGSGTEAGTQKGALVYRWQIVKQPRGSHAGIVNPTGKRARLMPDLPGRYQVKLVATRTSKQAAAEAVKTASASSTETSSTTPEPVCLPNLPLNLIPAAEQSTNLSPGSESESGAQEPFDPLEAPVCVTPTGETALTPLTPASAGATASDEMEVVASPTLSPMGLPIETIAADGSIRVGPQAYPKGAGFAHLLLLNDETLMLEKQAFFSLGEASAMATAVKEAGTKQIVVLTGMGQGQSEAPMAAQEALAESITALEGNAPPSDERATIIEAGHWSAIGIHGLPGYYSGNLFGAAEQTPVEAQIGSLPGSLNGHLQTIKGGVFSYVSTEYTPIDTRAAGSSTLVSVIKVGSESVTGSVPSGCLGLHIAVFSGESTGGKLTQVDNSTYVIDNPYDNTNVQGVREAAEDLQHWRTVPGNDLIVMQTVGEEGVAPYTQPRGAQNWVNDGLSHPTETGLFEWNEQPYVKVKHEPETEEVLDQFWNQQYPTVAGQVGDLTGSGGHDLVANLGIGNPQIEVTRLTMVAANQAQNPEANYVSGTAATSNGTPEGRLVGTLTRNDEAGWTVQGAAPAATFSPSKIWEMAYAEPTAWPDAQTGEDKEAMLAIAKQIYGPYTAITILRTQYPSDTVSEIQELQTDITRTTYQPTKEFTEATFNALRTQLLTEVNDVVAVKNAIDQWKSIYGNKTTDLIQAGNVSSRVTQEVIHNAAKEKTTEVEVNPLAIIGESLYTSADLIGFPEVEEAEGLPEVIGIIAGGVGIAEASTPEAAESPEGPESSLIRAEADEIGTKLAEHVEGAEDGLVELEEILVSDWGKLSKAAPEARENWKIEKTLKTRLQQALAIDTERQLYEGVLPTAFEQWVVSPYQTTYNGAGPQPPGTSYFCKSYGTSFPHEGEVYEKHPFKDEPGGGLSTSTYRPSAAPGDGISPAQPYTTPYSIRVLKSTSDTLKMQRVEVGEHGEEAVTIYHDGSSPKASLMNPLFEPVTNGESAVNPRRLGIDKAEFFATYGGGPADWKRTICAEQTG